MPIKPLIFKGPDTYIIEAVVQQKGETMKENYKDSIELLEELINLIKIRIRQMAFDDYPKELQDYMTKRGLNPYMNSRKEVIEYKDIRPFEIDTPEKH